MKVNMKPIMDLRKQYGEVFENVIYPPGVLRPYESGGAEALSEVNASIDGDDVVYHNYFDVSMAVSTLQAARHAGSA